MPRPARPRVRPPALLACALVATLTAALAACSDPQRGTDDAAPAADAVQVTSCGRTLAFDRPPERAVALDQSTTETMLALGLADRMAGTAGLKVDVAPAHRAAYERVPVLSPEVPTAEQLREATPDLVAASFADSFTRDRVGTRAELAGLGVPTYVSAVDCPEHAGDGGDGGATAFERLFADYETLGRIFGVESRARELADEQRRATEAAREAAGSMASSRARPTIVWLYSVYHGMPYVAGGTGLPSEMSQLVGADNAFDDIAQDWPEVSWEEIADRDPDVIVVGDLAERGAPGDSAAEKIETLRGDPVLSQLTAVREDHIIELPGVTMDPSVRSVEALDPLVAGLRELGYVR